MLSIRLLNLCVLPLVLSLASAVGTAQSKRSAPKPFIGRVVYHVASEGADTAQLAYFRAFSPASYTLAYGPNGKIRMTEEGGAVGGDVLVDLKRKRYYQLNHGQRSAVKLIRADFGSAFPQMLLAPGSGEDTISGYPCTRYKVMNSAFVRRNATAYLWITDAFTIPEERGEYRGPDGFRIFFPLPAILGINSGTVMRMVVQEAGVTITYTAEVSRTSVPASTFSVPKGYAVR